MGSLIGRTKLWEQVKTNRGRIITSLLLVYLYRLVEVGSVVKVSEYGFHWPDYGYQLFPIPSLPIGPGFFWPSPLSVIDSILYVTFVVYGIWVIWAIAA
ncbi:MAG: hypothetical protein ACW99J_18090, partial [Candidatus Thorarchaeota archaeon]